MVSEKRRKQLNAAARRWYNRNPEKAKASVVKWIKKNPEKVSEFNRACYLKNRDDRIVYQKNWYQENKESIRKTVRRQQEQNPAGYLLQNAKSRSKTKGLKFSISMKDIIVPEFCPVFGVKLKMGCRENISCSPSIDRINPALGYIAGNVQVISHKANRIKSNATIEELQKILDYMKGRLK